MKLFSNMVAIACLAGCGAPHPHVLSNAVPPIAPRPVKPEPEAARRRLLTIDWSAVHLASDADALALWTTIAPTGADWNERLDEVPSEPARSLAIALLHSGNFACTPAQPATSCGPPVLDVPDPAPDAGLADPCLRRLLALWAIQQVEPDDLPRVLDALRAIAALPPPESQLVVAALDEIPQDQQPLKLELLAIAWNAGQRELVNTSLGSLEEPQLIEAVTKHHIDGALEVLSAETHRATFLAAVTDEALPPRARTQAIGELAMTNNKFAPDLRAVLVKATATADCLVAANAARALAVGGGDKRYVPTRPRTNKPEALVRALCVLASYESLQPADEKSPLPTFVPAKGLERITVTYDALADGDDDGDGDPHTRRSAELVPQHALSVLKSDDLDPTWKCLGLICTAGDREYRFAFKPFAAELVLYRMEIVEHPPRCP